MAKSTFRKLNELIEILKSEEKIVLNGDLDKLQKFQSRKEKLIEGLNPAESKGASEQLSQIRTLAEGNLKLIDAAKKGILSVRKRIDELGRVSSGNQTYGSDGNRAQLNAGQPKKDISY